MLGWTGGSTAPRLWRHAGYQSGQRRPAPGDHSRFWFWMVGVNLVPLPSRLAAGRRARCPVVDIVPRGLLWVVHVPIDTVVDAPWMRVQVLRRRPAARQVLHRFQLQLEHASDRGSMDRRGRGRRYPDVAVRQQVVRCESEDRWRGKPRWHTALAWWLGDSQPSAEADDHQQVWRTARGGDSANSGEA